MLHGVTKEERETKYTHGSFGKTKEGGAPKLDIIGKEEEGEGGEFGYFCMRFMRRACKRSKRERETRIFFSGLAQENCEK